ncbi:MAG: acetylglutamate kinase [Phycisphaerales bacterium]|nr:acetylglutamate kinase [Phycisphaerales bacterium]
MHLQSNLKALRTAVPYIQAYRGRVFIVKLGGQLCDPGRHLDNIIDQLVLLHRLGIKLVVVHGGGEQASALGLRLGLQPNLFGGRRITDGQTLEVVKMAFAGTINTNLIAAFRRAEVPAIGISGIDGGLLIATKRPVQRASDPATGETREVDFGFVGDLVSVSVDILRHLLAGDCVPVVCSLAADEEGQILNVNADTIASRLAAAIGAAKYFLLTNVDGVMRDPRDASTLQSYLDVDELNQLVESGAISGGMLPKLAACMDALRGGVPRVHIINGTTPDALLSEVFTNEGCGTLIVAQRTANGGAPVTGTTAP